MFFEDWSIWKTLGVGVLFLVLIIAGNWPWITRMNNGIDTPKNRQPESTPPPE